MNRMKQDISVMWMLSEDAITDKEKEVLIKYEEEQGFEKIREDATKCKTLAFASHIFGLLTDHQRWKDVHDTFVCRNSKLLGILDNIFEDLRKKKCVSVCITENFGSVLRGDACIGCFQSSDIDLTADRNEQKKIESVFELYGFKKKSDTEQVTKYKNESVVEGGFSLQITWVAVSRTHLNQKKYTERLKKSRVEAKEIPGKSIKVLNPTEQLYFCCLHISCGHYYTLTPGIRLYVDIDRLIRGNSDINWKSLLAWSDQDNAGLRIILPIYLSHIYLRTPVPEEILQIIDNSATGRKARDYFIFGKGYFGCKSGRLHRLYVELISDGYGLFGGILRRIVKSGR